MRTLYAVLAVAVVAGCASITPVKLQSGDTCYRCHRTISDTKLAAEMLDQSDRVVTSYPFRTTACMAKYLKTHTPSTFTTIFVTDYRSGQMIEATSAWFVPTDLIGPDGKTIEHDYVAFGSRDDAKRFGQELPVHQWDQVLAEVVPE
jgi:hypothetical protein